jgi:hypothetical protein
MHKDFCRPYRDLIVVAPSVKTLGYYRCEKLLRPIDDIKRNPRLAQTRWELSDADDSSSNWHSKTQSRMMEHTMRL